MKIFKILKRIITYPVDVVKALVAMYALSKADQPHADTQAQIDADKAEDKK